MALVLIKRNSECQKKIYAGLPLPTFVGVRLFGVCGFFLQRNTLIFVLEVDITKIFKLFLAGKGRNFNVLLRSIMVLKFNLFTS